MIPLGILTVNGIVIIIIKDGIKFLILLKSILSKLFIICDPINIKIGDVEYKGIFFISGNINNDEAK
jgi:hypothetical protein